MLHRRRGFALGLVLIVMIVLIGLSAVIMDITTNYAGTSRSVVEREELFNAAQSGIEWGKAMLWVNSDDLDITLKSYNDSSDIFAVLSGDAEPIHDKGLKPVFEDITLNVKILDCNFDPPENPDDNVPPVVLPKIAGETNSGNEANLQLGYSNIIDPNRNISLFKIPGATQYFFLIRSIASSKDNGKKFGIDNMVVIWK